MASEATPDFRGSGPPKMTDSLLEANFKILRGNMVGYNAAGYIVPADTLANGCLRAAGVASATVDNTGGAQGALRAVIDQGLFDVLNSSTDPVTIADRDNTVYLQDGVTIARTSNGGTLPVAGTLISITAGGHAQVWVAGWRSQDALTNATVAGIGDPIQKRTATIGYAALSAAATTKAVNIGAVLPANSRIVGVSLDAFTPFAGTSVTNLTASVGTSAATTSLVNAADCFDAAIDGNTSTCPNGLAPHKNYSAAGAQLQALFTATGANLSVLSVGTVTVTVLFVALA